MTIEINNLHKHFGGVRALDNCNLKTNRGDITAVIGPNGSGKTTLFNTISKIVRAHKGIIKLNNKDITRLKDYETARLGISRTFQEVRLFKNLTIVDHLEIALCEQDENLINCLIKESKDNINKIKRILKLVRLEKPLNTLVTDLSYGQRKLLDLAIAIAKPHSVLLLDEPVAGVNPKLRIEIKEILRDLKKKGETILLIEHDMNFIMDLADYIFVMDQGRVITHGIPIDIKNNKKVLEVYLGG